MDTSPGRVLFLALLLLPPLVMIGVLLAITPLPGLSPPPGDPQWVLAGGELANCGAIYDFLTAQGIPTEALRDTRSDSVTRMQMQTAGSRLLNRMRATKGEPFVAAGPTLVRATFPDGEARNAWLYAEMVSLDPRFLSGEIALVYLDDSSGAPLLLIDAIQINDPLMGCGALPVDLPNFARVMLVGLLLAYGLLLGAGWLFFRWRRRRAAKRDLKLNEETT
jgi:hypothetical protein